MQCFKQFADSRLTREQMKAVKGGVSCTATWTSGGITYSSSQRCYTSVSDCMSSVNSDAPSGANTSTSCQITGIF